MRKYYLILILFLSLTSQIVPQNWFPMEVGNRWDYEISTYCHGGNWSHDTVSIIIIDKNNFGTNQNYFVFSPYGIFQHNILRFEDDSLYAFVEEDSTECLLLAFNQMDSSKYFAKCHYDSVLVWFRTADIFGYTDSSQWQGTGYIQYEISKKFGFIYSDDWSSGLCETWYYAKGCIISDTTYGVLLDVTEIQNENLNSFNLYHNYPNPFNPITTIKYQNPELSFVTLKVYDVLGNEIATLVNEEKPAGIYEVNFIAANLPSGIYFYRIQAGTFIETKKMLLLK